MNEATILARLEQLRQERQHLVNQMMQLEPKIVAYDGAIEDCEFWLEKVRAASDSQPGEFVATEKG